MTREELFIKEKKKYGLDSTISKEEKSKLEKGIPFQHIIGFINFDDLKIEVNNKVLIPRYETEEVVLKALEYINKDSSVLDLGTGTGYIGLTIKKKTGASVLLSDISMHAINLAKKNAKKNNLDVQIIHSDLFDNIDGKFDVIISNPPYIPKRNKLDPSVVDHEPLDALFGGEDGNDFYKRIIQDTPEYLNPEGTLIFEISPDNVKYIKSKGFTIFKDINKKERIALKTFDK